MTCSNDKGVGPVFEATLMRFVDGDLPQREHAFVARLIAAHPDASRSVLAYRFKSAGNDHIYWRTASTPVFRSRNATPNAARTF
jgi:anti-sigma factor RsiW